MDVDSESVSTPHSADSTKSRALHTTSHISSLEGSFGSPTTPPYLPNKALCITPCTGYSQKPGAIVYSKAEILEPAVDEYVSRIKAHCRKIHPPFYKEYQNNPQKSSDALLCHKSQGQDQRAKDQILKPAPHPSALSPFKPSTELTLDLGLEPQLEARISESIHRFQASFVNDSIDFSAANDDVPDFCVDQHLRNSFPFYGSDQPDQNQNPLNNNMKFLAQNFPPLGSDFDYANYIYGEHGGRGGSTNQDECSHRMIESEREFVRRVNKARYIRDKAASEGYALRNGEVPFSNGEPATKPPLLTLRGGASSSKKLAEQYQKALEQGRKDYDKLFKQNLGIGSTRTRPNDRSLYDSSLEDWEPFWGPDVTGGFNADDRADEDGFEGGFRDSDQERDSDATIYEEDM